MRMDRVCWGYMLGWICEKIKAGRLIDWQIGSSKVAIDRANSRFLTLEYTGQINWLNPVGEETNETVRPLFLVLYVLFLWLMNISHSLKNK